MPVRRPVQQGSSLLRGSKLLRIGTREQRHLTFILQDAASSLEGL